MPEIFSLLFAAFILAASFKLFFDDWKHLKESFKHFLWWFGFSVILEWSPETKDRGFRFLFRLCGAAVGGLLLYHNLSK